MNNIYIFKIEDFTEQDALLVKKFDKSDKVIFMPNETGMISYALFPILATWKTEPIFMQPIADCSDTEPMLFLLGLQCADCNGDLYIVMRDNPFKSLEACEFGTSKGHVCIHVAESLADVLPKKKTRQGKRLELAAENEPQTANTEEEIYTDDLQTAVPDKFANAIASIEATTGVNFAMSALIIAWLFTSARSISVRYSVSSFSRTPRSSSIKLATICPHFSYPTA